MNRESELEYWTLQRLYAQRAMNTANRNLARIAFRSMPDCAFEQSATDPQPLDNVIELRPERPDEAA